MPLLSQKHSVIITLTTSKLIYEIKFEQLMLFLDKTEFENHTIGTNRYKKQKQYLFQIFDIFSITNDLTPNF